MVTVVKTPQGHKIIDQAVTAEITEDYVGDAIVTLAGHSLTTGDTVYITSDIDEYNGFWYVTTITVDTFKISEHSESDFVEYYQDADIEYYQTQPHDWSSIFLPIVYKATNTFWPTNSVDTARTVSSFSDDNGFTQVTLSGALRSSVKAFEFVEVSGMVDSEYNGVWQIVEVTSTSDVVLNLPYADDLSFSGATIQYYYNNYQVKVRIFSGLPASHPWYAKKPYTEVAELSLTPDENNEVMFSVADYIQGQVNIRNNPTLFSMPLNLDAFTGFYIATGETYDQSDNYSLYTTDALFEDDDFEGYAIAGKLPFKNVYSGDYADYVYTSGSPAQWLTNRARLLAVEGYYFDVSFIKNTIGAFSLSIVKYVSDYGITETQAIEDQGIGVYRMQITPDANYDSFCITAGVPDFTPEALDALNLWLENGTGEEWTDTTTPVVQLTDTDNSENKYTEYAFVSGKDYVFAYSFETTVTGVPILSVSRMFIRIKNSSDVVLDEFEVDMIGANVPLPALNTWQNIPTINANPWTVTSTPNIHLDGSDSDNTSSEHLYADYAFVNGVQYTIEVSMTIVLNSGVIGGTSRIYITDTSNVQQVFDSTANTVGTTLLSVTFTADADCQRVAIGVSGALGTADITATINSATVIYFAPAVVTDTITFTAPATASRISISADQTGTGVVDYIVNSFTSDTEPTTGVTLTEEICIDILETCEVEGGFTPETARRLTEDGGYRLLE